VTSRSDLDVGDQVRVCFPDKLTITAIRLSPISGVLGAIVNDDAGGRDWIPLGNLERIAPPADPADDAAWPLPEGWRWSKSAWGQHVACGGPSSAWVEDGKLNAICSIPLDVVRVLLARWEAGQR
jgi:hypothetical protein